MMRKNVQLIRAIMAALFCISILERGLAQDKTYETLTGSGSAFKPGFTINPAVNYARAGKGNLLSLNISAGLVFKDSWTIGGFFNSSMNDFRPEKLNVAGTYADVQYGGLHLEYTMRAHKVFHLSFPLQVGYGEIELDSEGGSPTYGEEQFFVVKPGVMGEMNINHHIRLQAGINYRFASNFGYQNLSAGDISSLNLQLGMRVGIFHKKISQK